MFGNLGFWEITVLALVILLVFGAKRLPEIGQSLGKGIREFKRSFSEVNEAVTSLPEERPSASRELDSPSQQPAGSEPKRLSQ
jgi:sec-independent protein translocase protein TatA